MLYIGSDHAGYNLKEEIKDYLGELDYIYEDLGNKELDYQDDYVDFAVKVAEKVSADKNAKGILFCGTGVGVCIAANKFKDVRAALVYDEFSAKSSREDDDANILCLGGRTISPELAQKIVKIWIETDFSGGERHVRRLKKIEEIEN